MNRILAVAVLSIAAPFAFAACDRAAADEPATPAAVVDVQPFIDVYLGAITGTDRAPGEHPPATSPLEELLGGGR